LNFEYKSTFSTEFDSQRRRKYGLLTKAEFDEFYKGKGFLAKLQPWNVVNSHEAIPYDKKLEINCNAFQICTLRIM